MNDTLRGFGGNEIFTLTVGSNKQILSVQKAILMQVPYFKAALNSGQFVESQKNVFDLPEDNPKAVADVLFFVYSGHLDHFDGATGLIPDPQEHEKLMALVYAYVTADKWGAEGVANRLVDCIIHYHNSNLVHLEIISILSSAGYQNSPLYKCLLDYLAYFMLVAGYSEWHEFSQLWERPDHRPEETFATACSRLSRDDLVAILSATQQEKVVGGERSISAAMHNPCSLHKHERTDPCAPNSKSRQ